MNYERSTKPFHALLQNWRADMGLTRAGAASALGVSAATFDGWLAGRRCGRELPIRKLMDFLVKSRHGGAEVA